MEREDVPDPCADYFGSGVMGGVAGGLRGYGILEPKPYDIEVELNGWFRFDRAGTYRFYVRSHRLTRESLGGESKDRVTEFAAVSNILEIRIIEDAAWEASKLGEIRQVFDESGDQTPAAQVDRVWLAERELRYLATPAAVELAFEQARRTGGMPNALLLAGARDRSHMLREFDCFLGDPATTIAEPDIGLRALFTYIAKERPKPLPRHRWEVSSEEEWPKLRGIAEERYKRYERYVHDEAVRLIPAVRAKTGDPRRNSAKVIAELAKDEARAAGFVEPENYGFTRGELIAQFASFTAERQEELLGPKWDAVRGPEMIRPLQAVVASAPARSLPKNAFALQVWGTGAGVAESALRRLAELAPAEVERILRQDLASGRPRFAGFAVREFPAGGPGSRPGVHGIDGDKLRRRAALSGAVRISEVSRAVARKVGTA